MGNGDQGLGEWKMEKEGGKGRRKRKEENGEREWG